MGESLSPNSLNNERDHLEIEKQKIELEKQKYSEQDKKIGNKSIILIAAFVFLAVALISLFLPWLHMTAGSFLNTPYGGGSASITGDSISAIISPEGILSLILLVASAFLLIKGKYLSYVFALTTFLLAIIFMNRMSSLHSSMSGTGFSASADVVFDEGSWLFLSTSFLYAIFAALNVHLKRPVSTSQGNTKVKYILIGLLQSITLFLMFEGYSFEAKCLVFLFTIVLFAISRYNKLRISAYLFLCIILFNTTLFCIKYFGITEGSESLAILNIILYPFAIISTWGEIKRHSFFLKLNKLFSSR